VQIGVRPSLQADAQQRLCRFATPRLHVGRRQHDPDSGVVGCQLECLAIEQQGLAWPLEAVEDAAQLVEDVSLLRIHPQRRPVGRLRRAQVWLLVAQSLVGVAQAVVHLQLQVASRAASQGVLEGAHGTTEAPLCRQRPSQARVGLRVVGTLLHEGAELDRRSLEGALRGVERPKTLCDGHKGTIYRLGLFFAVDGRRQRRVRQGSQVAGNRPVDQLPGATMPCGRVRIGITGAAGQPYSQQGHAPS